MYKRVFLFIILFGGIINPTSIVSQVQSGDSLWIELETVRRSEPWLSNDNASGLSYLSDLKLSDIRISISKNDGDFVNYYQSGNSFEYGAKAESFYRLDKRIVFYGKIAYSAFEGKNMGGSAFIDPYRNPFDIVEYVDSTRGTKELEQYHLIGAMSMDLSGRFTLGGKIDYTAANYSKRRDLRHATRLMNLSLTLGGLYKLNERIEAGANFHYNRRIESVEFSSLGNKDKRYTSLINFGSFMGKFEEFTDNSTTAFTRSGGSFPVVNNTYGGSLQLGVEINPELKFLNDLLYHSKSGYYGRKGTNTVVFTEHDIDSYQYSGAFTLKGGRNLHTFGIKAGYDNLKNDENIYRQETSPENDGKLIVVYYGKSERLKQDIINGGVYYTFDRSVDKFNPEWTIKTGADYFQRKQTTSFYPYYRKQTLKSYQVYLNVTRSFIRDNNRYSFCLGALYGSGSGDVKKDGLYITPSDEQSEPKTIDRYLYREFEYFTADRIRGEIAFDYSRILKQPDIRVYARIQYNYTKAFDVTYLEGDHHSAFKLSIGCRF